MSRDVYGTCKLLCRELQEEKVQYLLILYVYDEKGFVEDVGLLKTFSVTDIGKKRKLNQDYIFSSDRKIGNLSNDTFTM